MSDKTNEDHVELDDVQLDAAVGAGVSTSITPCVKLGITPCIKQLEPCLKTYIPCIKTRPGGH